MGVLRSMLFLLLAKTTNSAIQQFLGKQEVRTHRKRQKRKGTRNQRPNPR